MRPFSAVTFLSCLACLAGPGLPAARADATAAAIPADAPEGLGLDGFAGEESIAAALRRAGDAPGERAADRVIPGLELRGLSIRGPGDQDARAPIAAEVSSRIERLDLTAGVQASEESFTEGPSQWIGRIGLNNDRPDGSERLEVRTTLGRRTEGGILGIEIGPRLERRLRRGTTFFIDGTAEARAARLAAEGGWFAPGAAADDASMVGVNARTGIVR